MKKLSCRTTVAPTGSRLYRRLVIGTPPRLLALVLVLALVSGGCHLARETANLPVQMVTAVVPGSKTTQPDPAVLQAELLRYGDDFSGRTTIGIDDYVRQVNTPAARLEALNWKLSLNSSVMGIATGANPTANLVDFLALASLTRAFLEQAATNVSPSGACDVWLQNSRELETNAWKMAGSVLSPEHQAEFSTAINQWLKENAATGKGFFRRPQGFASAIRDSRQARSQTGSVFSLVGLDPTVGLDPAVREITRTRLFAERALYAMERMPFLLSWQTELLAEQVLRQDQVTNALATTERLSRAAESASQTVAALPDRLTAERKAVVDALEAQEGKLRDLSAEVGRALAAGEKMSISLNTTITTFDALMKRFGVGEPDTSPPNTNSPPFNILDYARTAEQIALMAGQLDALIKDTTGTLDAPALDKRIADLNALSARARGDAKSVLNHAFLLAGGLVLLILACAVAYRRLVPRGSTTPPAERLPESKV